MRHINLQFDLAASLHLAVLLFSMSSYSAAESCEGLQSDLRLLNMMKVMHRPGPTCKRGQLSQLAAVRIRVARNDCSNWRKDWRKNSNSQSWH